MKTISIILAGFGNVGKAFINLINQKEKKLLSDHDLSFKIKGISTGSHGVVYSSSGFDKSQLLSVATNNGDISSLTGSQPLGSTSELIQVSGADLLLENTPVNYETGQPAISHLQTALEHNMHAVTANKGPIIHAYQELTELAKKRGKKFLFESTVMDGAPVFSVFREVLPGADIVGFEGILNSCTNLILGLMEDNYSFEEAVKYAQSIGIAETDPSGDIDGWDAAIKIAAISTVLLKYPIPLNSIERKGISEINQSQIIKAKDAGKKWKLVCSAKKENNSWKMKVSPQLISSDNPIFNVNGTSSFIRFETDVLPGLGILESNPGPKTTAYGLLADILNIYKNEK